MPKAPRRVASRTIARYPYLSLTEHDVVNDDGGAPRTAVTIELWDWCVVPAVTREGSWVFVEQHRHGVDAATVEPAGGIIERGEPADVAATRELLEETGFGGGEVRSLGWVHPNPALSSNRAFMFLVENVERVAEPENPPDERTHVVLVDDAGARALIADGRLSHALGVLAVERSLALRGAR
ncbi:MAG: NUDIX hydrolase [Polyangiaceae bacterium]